MANGDDRRRGGHLPPLAQVVEFDFTETINSVTRLDEIFSSIADSSARLLDNIRTLNNELRTTVGLAGGVFQGPVGSGATGGVVAQNPAERTRELREIGRSISEGIGSGGAEAGAGAFLGGLLPSFGSFPALGVASYPTAAQLGFQAFAWPHLRSELDFQSYGRFSPAFQGAGDYLTSILGVRPDLLQSSIRLDAARTGAAIGQFSYPAYRIYRGLTSLGSSTLEGIRDVRASISGVRAGTIPSGVSLVNEDIPTPRRALGRLGGTFASGVGGLALGQLVAGPIGAIGGAAAGFISSDLISAPLLNYLLTDDSLSESYQSSVTGPLARRTARRIGRDIYNYVASGDVLDDINRTAAIGPGIIGNYQSVIDFFRGDEPVPRTPLLDLLPGFRYPDVASLRFGARTGVRARPGGLGALYGNISRFEDFTAASIADIPRGSDLYNRFVRDRGYGSAGEASEAFRGQSRAARNFLGGEIRALPFFQEITERGAIAETVITDLSEAAATFGQVGAASTRQLLTNLGSIGDVAQTLVRTFAEMAIQVAVLSPVRGFLESAFSTAYGAATGNGLPAAPSGGTVRSPGFGPGGGFLPNNGNNVTINYNSDITRREAVELDAVSVAIAEDNIRKARSQITSDHYDGSI